MKSSKSITNNSSTNIPKISHLKTSKSTTKKKKPKSQKKKSKSKPKTLESSKKTEEEKTNYEIELKPEIDLSQNIISEKRTKDSIKRLISTSKELLNQQNLILEDCEKLSKEISVNDYEIDREKIKLESENFPELFKNYTENLNYILNKLRKNNDEFEKSKKLKEENNSLKYKIQMLSIDKSDDYLTLESKLNSVRNVYSNEINSMINFFNEIGLENLSFDKINNNNFSEDKIINFFALMKKHFKDLKNKIISQDEKIKYLAAENSKIIQNLDNFQENNNNYLSNSNLNNNNKENFMINNNNNSNNDFQDIRTKTRDLLNNSSQMNNNNNNNNNNNSENFYNYNYNNKSNPVFEMSNSSYLDYYKRNKELKYDNYDPNHLDLEHKYNDSAFYNNSNTNIQQSQILNNFNDCNNNSNNFLNDSNNNNNNNQQMFTYQQES